MRVWEYESMRVYEYESMRVWEYESIWVWEYGSMIREKDQLSNALLPRALDRAAKFQSLLTCSPENTVLASFSNSFVVSFRVPFWRLMYISCCWWILEKRGPVFNFMTPSSVTMTCQRHHEQFCCCIPRSVLQMFDLSGSVLGLEFVKNVCFIFPFENYTTTEVM